MPWFLNRAKQIPSDKYDIFQLICIVIHEKDSEDMKLAYVKLGQVCKCYSSNCEPHNTSLTSKVNLSLVCCFQVTKRKDDLKKKLDNTLLLSAGSQSTSLKLPFATEAYTASRISFCKSF
ncbi:UNVERIFIED_CONTAM: hypothetical protein K2H54_061849 [Gekko kuhli]